MIEKACLQYLPNKTPGHNAGEFTGRRPMAQDRKNGRDLPNIYARLAGKDSVVAVGETAICSGVRAKFSSVISSR